VQLTYPQTPHHSSLASKGYCNHEARTETDLPPSSSNFSAPSPLFNLFTLPVAGG
jgi:hypothetical protein